MCVCLLETKDARHGDTVVGQNRTDYFIEQHNIYMKMTSYINVVNTNDTMYYTGLLHWNGAWMLFSSFHCFKPSKSPNTLMKVK